MTTAAQLSGYTIGAIAAASGASFLDIALGVAAVVSGVAGPEAGLEGPAGDLIHPGLNLVVAGRSPSWCRAYELLIEPAKACQEMCRSLSRNCNVEKLDHLEFNNLSDPTGDIVEKSRALFGTPATAASYIGEKRHVSVLRTPSFLLHSPDHGALKACIPEAMDAHVLALYPDGQLLDSTNSKTDGRLAFLAAAVLGQDQPFDSKRGNPRLITVRAQLFMTAGRGQIQAAIDSDDPLLDRIFRQCVFTVPSTTTATLSPANVRWGYKGYYDAVKAVLDARRQGGGYQLILKPEKRDALQDFAAELQARVATVPDRVKPYFSQTLSLPYRLYWACLATLTPRESDDWVLPFTMQTTRQVIDGQQHLLEELLTGAEKAEHERARAAMLWKLADKPLTRRDLFRRYAVQRREIHEPVLRELITEGLITAGDRLELSAEGRSQLAA